MAKASRRLVVDASVARAAGGEGATHPLSRQCRDCLLAMLHICHRIVMTAEIGAEWKRHRSRFAMTWLTSMEARRKVWRPAAPADTTLLEKLRQAMDVNTPT